MLDPKVEARFARIESLLHAGMVRGNEMERRWNAAHEKAMRRMDRAEARMDRAEARMDVFDKKLEATRKLVEAGIKFVNKMAVETREIKQSQKILLDSLRRGNGNGHKGPR